MVAGNLVATNSQKTGVPKRRAAATGTARKARLLATITSNSCRGLVWLIMVLMLLVADNRW
ncbi:hypothetical protein AWC25_17965 [Mycobacterium sherrisii]|uniref:Uncharacterized protein n=1 Tax=Mycobacterium sherrisii TaxID=243061 RepID=A0A1E3ST76_9MYCO|nr:hypothetical protein [Mycobacterium sherrisii]ODR05354.1 hypothetical protein BHQ21_14205 [Mycobacterium sherrisii]ORW73279.1 hypothetical protein AWC25_17965 [Mycobacterium sherrisii]